MHPTFNVYFIFKTNNEFKSSFTINNIQRNAFIFNNLSKSEVCAKIASFLKVSRDGKGCYVLLIMPLIKGTAETLDLCIRFNLIF